ncbi:MAG: MraY family glycosyltransferase [Pseudomonadota bacterium]
MPDSRKVHTIPIPRIGGLAIALGVLIPLLIWVPRSIFINAYMVSAGILIAFGLVDDLKGLGYKLKFLGQVLAALIMLFYGDISITNLGTLLPDGTVLPNWLAVVLTLLVIVGVTNAINLSDGLDGLAGGISLLGFFCIGFLAYLIQDNTVLFLSLAFVGAIFGFLRYNTYPASIFMGDTGSQLLGFSAIVLAIKITQENSSMNPVLPLIIMGFPILDTLTVMLERMKQGRSPFSPDKNHFHHRLISIGFFHTEAVVIIYLIQSLMIISAILFRYYFAHQCFAGYLIFSALFISAFAIADRKGFQVKRYHLIDNIIKGRLAIIRDKHLIIRISFEASKVLIPLIFMFSCFLPKDIPGYASYIALGFGLLIIVLRIFGKNAWALGLRAALYLSIPLILYLSQEGIADWMKPEILMGYHIGLAVMAFFVILTIKFSRRSKGFHVTTMDFLVLFIAIVIPNLPVDSIQSHLMGVLVVKLIVILFSYEVLITELRGEFNALTISTLAGLGIIGVRGLM